MPANSLPQQPSHLTAGDVMFALFKHKWKILGLGLLGIGAAVAYQFFHVPLYQSEAKLLVRYVLDRSSVDAIANTTESSKTNDSVIDAEVEILKSWDLATQVAEVVGIDRLQPDASKTGNKGAAAAQVRLGLTVGAKKGSNVIAVSYANADPALAGVVLEQLVTLYFSRHLEVHRSKGAFEFVAQQADQVRARLSDTEEQLKQRKAEAQINSLAESTASINAAVSKAQDDLRQAETERAEQVARVKELEKVLAGASASDGQAPSASATQADSPAAEPAASTIPPAAPGNPPTGSTASANQPTTSNAPENQPATPPTSASQPPAPGTPASQPAAPTARPGPGEIQKYKDSVARLTQLRQMEAQQLSTYKPESPAVKVTRSQIAGLEGDLREMEKQFPAIIATAPTHTSQTTGPDFLSERARLAATHAKIEALKVQLTNLQQRAKQLAEITPQIEQLERKKELEEANYKYLGASLERARVDEALDPSKIPNISVVQKPSPAGRNMLAHNKMVLGLAGGGFGAGIALALLLGLVLDHSVKRPHELEDRMHIPMLLSIPFLGATRRLPFRRGKAAHELSAANGSNGHSNIAPWDASHFIRPYSEAIRDRLGAYFELSGMAHKPKLLAVTGFSKGAGTSTLAAGVAAALSETGTGKVLLVDMNIGKAGIHPFFDGKPVASIADLPEGDAMPAETGNAFLSTLASPESRLALAPIKRLHELLPNLKASEFDYIVFDMPPIDGMSPTSTMVRHMDKVLLIVEAEKDNADKVRRGYAELVAHRANVSCVFNKAHSYLPKSFTS